MPGVPGPGAAAGLEPHVRLRPRGTRHDRDVNAAKNILAAGLAAGAGNGVDACGGAVRRTGTPRTLAPVKQEPRPAREGIPAL